MLLDLKQLFIKYNIKPNGVIQVGAHFFEEKELYESLSINDFVLIEPCRKAFKVMRERTNAHIANYTLFNVACGEENGEGTMHVETANGGMSNSLLKPDKHTEMYPSIVFHDTEEVEVRKLDSLPFDRTKYDFLNLDTQCSELMVLKGATETLKYINWIVAEVNQVGASLYENCTNILELDEFLKPFGFYRPEEPKWIGGKWADSLWLKR